MLRQDTMQGMIHHYHQANLTSQILTQRRIPTILSLPRSKVPRSRTRAQIGLEIFVDNDETVERGMKMRIGRFGRLCSMEGGGPRRS